MAKINSKKKSPVKGAETVPNKATIDNVNYKASEPVSAKPLDAIAQVKDIPCDFDLITYAPDGSREFCYKNKPEGLFLHKAINGVACPDGIKLANSPIDVLFKFKSNQKSVNAGKTISFINDFGEKKEASVTYKELQQSSTVLREKLAELGLGMPLKTPNSRDFLMLYLNASNPSKVKTSIQQTGWINTDTGPIFALPNELIGDTTDSFFIINTGKKRSNDYVKTKGTLADWQKYIGKPAESSSRVMTAICTVLASPLIEITNSENFAVHFRGGSSSGKTLLLRIARSVIGDLPLMSWTCTNNQLEQRMVEHNSLSVVMDEISQNDNLRDLHKKIYRMINGIGKGRMNSKLESEEVETWTATLVSAGEKGNRQVEEQYGIAPEAGTENRFLDIPINTGTPYRSNEYLPINPNTNMEFKNIGEYALYLGDLLAQKKAKYCGAPFEAWIKCLLSYINDGIGDMPHLSKIIMKYHDEFFNQLIRKQDSDQIQRALRHFALMYAAGAIASGEGEFVTEELLKSLGYNGVNNITGWNKSNVFEAIKQSYEAWREEFSDGENREETVLREKTFLWLTENERYIFEKGKEPPYASNVYGWRENKDNEIRYFIKSEIFQKYIANTVSERKLLRELGILKVTQKGQGLMHRYKLCNNDIRNTYQIWVPKPSEDEDMNATELNLPPELEDTDFPP